MDVRPIRTESDYEEALKEVDALFHAAPNTPEGDRLEVLTTLIEAYEALQHPIGRPDPVEAILHHLESRGLAPHDLAPYLGGHERVFEVLRRERPLSLDMVRNLHTHLGIPAEVLIQPYPLQRTAA